jgi:hypothetical protein
MTSENIDQYGRIAPMLAAIEALVKCESPSEDIDACRSVVALASESAVAGVTIPQLPLVGDGRLSWWWLRCFLGCCCDCGCVWLVVVVVVGIEAIGIVKRVGTVVLLGTVIEPKTVFVAELKLIDVVPVVFVFVATTFKYHVFGDPSKLVGLKTILDLFK